MKLHIPKVKIPRLLIVSAILTLLGLALMVWSVIQPTPLPTILAMSLGQVFGMGAFGLYILAIVIDLRRDARAHRRLIDEDIRVAGGGDPAGSASGAGGLPRGNDEGPPPPPPRGESGPP